MCEKKTKINNLKNKGENKKKYRGKIKDPNALSNLFPQFKKLEGREYNREKIRIRDKHTCQICGKNWEDGQRRFDVHHIDCIKEKTTKTGTSIEVRGSRIDPEALIYWGTSSLCFQPHPEYKGVNNDLTDLYFYYLSFII